MQWGWEVTHVCVTFKEPVLSRATAWLSAQPPTGAPAVEGADRAWQPGDVTAVPHSHLGGIWQGAGWLWLWDNEEDIGQKISEAMIQFRDS